MEIYAGFLTHTDEQIGRVVQQLEKLGVLDDTLIVFLSDNGASGEGGQAGRFNDTISLALPVDGNDLKLGLENIDLLGSEHARNHYPLGWANAGNTPFPWYKVLVHAGGIKDPLVIRYPAAIPDPGAVRGQYHHVSDITPTVLEALGLEKPASIKGVSQKPFTGVSLQYTFSQPEAPTRKRVQYYEIMGNRGVWKDGWKAVVNHTFSDSYADDVWELYHTDADYSEAHDVADQYPEKLRELQDEFLIEAAKNNVFPMLPGSFHSGKAKAGGNGLPGWSYSDYRRSFHLITKPFDLPIRAIPVWGAHIVTARVNRRGDGVIFSSGSRFGGFVLYVQAGRLTYVYNTGEREWYQAESKDTVPLGPSTLQFRFARTGEKTAAVRLYINGGLQGQLEISGLSGRSGLSSAFTSTVGGNKYSPVSEAYETPFAFDGEIEQLDLQVSAQAPSVEEEIRQFFAED
jgi:arylsulfatase